MDPTSGPRVCIDATRGEPTTAGLAGPEADVDFDDPDAIVKTERGEVVVDSREPTSTKDAAACHRR
jgi:hypothetical protein